MDGVVTNIYCKNAKIFWKLQKTTQHLKYRHGDNTMKHRCEECANVCPYCSDPTVEVIPFKKRKREPAEWYMVSAKHMGNMIVGVWILKEDALKQIRANPKKHKIIHVKEVIE